MKAAPLDRPPLDDLIDFDSSSDIESLALRVPARWVVYLFADKQDRAIQLLCVKNLRASLRRRLGPESDVEPSKRVDYRQLVRRVYWTRVDSEFEADLLYLRTVRELFPAGYAKLVALRPAWFVEVDCDARFPRYSRTDAPGSTSGEVFGPLEDKATATRLIERLEDWFDLCRYHNILQQAPHGKACAYKEMGRCPAPCDGSVSMEQYRQLVRLSAKTLADPDDYIRAQQARMQQAASSLQFEAAGRIKAYIASLSQLTTPVFRNIRRFEDLRFVTLQHGPSRRAAKVFLVTPTEVRPIACLLDKPSPGSGIVQAALAAASRVEAFDIGARETFGIVARHLFAEKQAGIWIPIDKLDESSLAKAYGEIRKDKSPDVAAGQSADDDASGDEGIVREIQPFVQI